MASVDPRTGSIVIRVVYDGAPMAGKSTSVRALGKGLGTSVTTPGEVKGRTLYFDWLDYTGGLFEGRRIRCQVISVPGQATLAPRRRRLLERADAVVFVGNSTPAGFQADRSYLKGLCGVLDRLGDPRVGIVFQANKRDSPDAVSLKALRSMLDEVGRIGLIESVATAGAGIREAFVFAVRLALDRVRELSRLGLLPMRVPEIDAPGDLLAELVRSEPSALALTSESGLGHIRAAELRGASDLGEAMAPDGSTGVEMSRSPGRPPDLPDPHVASGLIWPPVEGRLVLHELTGLATSLRQLPCGSWTANADERWSLHSSAEASFSELEEGRAMLIQLARQYATAQDRDHTVVLAEDGQGSYRLWEITRKPATTG